MPDPTIRVERDGPITTVSLNRPEVRNAVDRPTAAALAEAFLAFERDDQAKVGVFCGEHGTFCAGADLKAVSSRQGNRTPPPATGSDWDPLASDGPMGPSRMFLSKPVIAAVSGYAVAGGLSCPSGATCGSSRRTPCSVSSVDAGVSRWWTGVRSGCRASWGMAARST